MSNKNLLALAALMAASAASAQAVQPQTHAGTEIRNVATLTYDDPKKPGTPVPPVTSNTVVTKVAAVPNFTITPNQTQGDTGEAIEDAPGQTNDKVAPGQVINFKYDVTNTGNTPVIVELDPNTGKRGTVQRTDNAVEGEIEYFLEDGTKLVDTDRDGLVEIPQLAVGETVKITQRYKVPDAAVKDQQYGANPVGTATYNATNPELGTKVEPDGNMVTIPGQPGQLIDQNNFNRVTVVETGIDHTPPPTPTDPENPGNPQPKPPTPTDPTPGEITPPPPPGNPGGTPPTPGTGVPDKPVEPNNPPGTNNGPRDPGYKDPNPNRDDTPTPIKTTPGTDEQIAYPPADNNKEDDKVTFVNVVTNKGALPEVITISDKPKVTSPTETGATATTSDPKRGGQPIPDEDLNTPGIQITLQPGETITYRTTVTYPDRDDSTTKREPIVVEVPVTTARGDRVTTRDIVMPPATRFGDTLDEGGQPNVNGLEVTPTPKPVQVVDPSKDPSTDPINSPQNSDSTAAFPMTVTNPGAYNDTYIIEGTVPTLNDAPVRYFDATTGQELAKVPGTNSYITPVVEAGKKLNLYAVVDVPQGTAVGDYPVEQKIKANYSKIELDDTNDIIRVQAVGDVKIAKFQQSVDPAVTGGPVNGINSPAGFTPDVQERVPGTGYKYRIVAKNDYNVAVKDAQICDATPQGVFFTKVAAIGYNGDTTATQAGAPLNGYANNAGDIVPAQSEGKTYCVTFPNVDANSEVTVEFDALLR